MQTTTDLFDRLIPLLERAGIPYMVAGSVASSVHGSPRSTQDVDLVIAPDHASLLRLLRSLPQDTYYFSEEAALHAFAEKGQFNIIDFKTGWKVDFILRKARPFSKLEFERRQVEVVDGIQLFVARPEDVLISKLEWARLGSSERQISRCGRHPSGPRSPPGPGIHRALGQRVEPGRRAEPGPGCGRDLILRLQPFDGIRQIPPESGLVGCGRS